MLLPPLLHLPPGLCKLPEQNSDLRSLHPLQHVSTMIINGILRAPAHPPNQFQAPPHITTIYILHHSPTTVSHSEDSLDTTIQHVQTGKKKIES